MLQEPRSHTKELKEQAVPADQAVTAPADIKLSGIAWQEERRARRAVVNGFLMREGGVVSGARITDIYQDRVRFSQSGKTFEIPLTSSAVPAAGK
jgi:general secretion pathway protein B